MKTSNQRMNYTLETLRRDTNALSSYRYIDKHEITDFYICEDPHPELTNETLPENAKWEKGKVGEIWNGFDRYRWVKFDIEVPGDCDVNSENGKYLLYIDGRLHAPGYTGEFEGTVFIDGKPYQGVDQNHMEVFLDKKFAGRKLTVLIRFWSGRYYDNGPYTMIRENHEMSLCRLENNTDELYYDARNLLDAVDLAEDMSSDALDLVDLCTKSFHEIDWAYCSKEDKTPFYDSIARAHKIMENGYKSFNKKSNVTVHIFGQTHIDIAWLWRIKNTKEKAVRSFATVLRNMEHYPDFTFFQSQPQLYEFVKKEFPEEYKEIKARIKEGRWNADGAMWLEPDCNLPCGESFVRQLLYGKRFLKKEFGVNGRVVWVPDCFGFNAALPQILKKAGVTAFATSKMCWSDYNRMPHDTFLWKGIDGTKILTCFVTTPVLKNYDDYGTTCNGIMNAKTVLGSWDHYRDKELSRDVFFTYGYGDGGGGPTRDAIEDKRRIAKLPGMPNVKDSGLTQYVDLMNEKVKKADDVAEWNGELYLENHRGTLTSQALVKKSNRKLEFLLRSIEAKSVAVFLETGKWDKVALDDLHKIYKAALLNQFHDILPGSGVNDIYKDAHAAYEKAFKDAHKVAASLDEKLPKSENAMFSVFNPDSFASNSLVEYKSNDPSLSFKTKETALDSQRTENGYLVDLKNVSPLAFTPIYKSEEKKAPAKNVLTLTNNVYETPYYKFEINENGRIINLYDRKAKRSVLSEGGLGNALCTYEDRPLCYDAWNVDVLYKKKSYPVNDLKFISIVENGSLRAKIRLSWIHFDSKITQDIVLYKNSPRIDFVTKVNWNERHQLLRTSFDVNVTADKATYDIPFGNFERPTHSNTSWDFAKFEVCAHKWEDLSETGYGVALMNDCKYGCSIKGNNISLSLLKSAGSPDPEADTGEHEFTYSLLPHKGTWKDVDIEKSAYALNNPAVVEASPLSTESLFKVPDGIEIDAVKKCEDSDNVILRIHEYLGKRSNINITSDHTIKSFCETDLLENETAEKKTADRISLEIKPYEIKTIKVMF